MRVKYYKYIHLFFFILDPLTTFTPFEITSQPGSPSCAMAQMEHTPA